MSNKIVRSISKLLITSCILLPALLFSSGCALFSKEDPVDPNDKTLSLVFGYFDLKDAPSWGGVDWVSIKQYKPKPSYYGTDVEDGLFFHIGVANKSSIQVDEFGRNTRWYSNATYTYGFGGNGRNETALVIKKPGVYFLGSYKYQPIEAASFFEADKFDMVKSKSPTEKELLTKVLKLIKEDSDYNIYHNQIKMVEKRLKYLNKKG